MANVKFLTGSLAQYQALGANVNSDTLYFLDSGDLYKGALKMGGNKIQVVTSYPDSPLDNVLYINSTDGSMKFGSTEVEPAIVSAIVVDADNPENDTPDNNLPTVGAVKAFVAAAIAALPDAVDYTVSIEDGTAGENDFKVYDIKQESSEEDDKVVGSIAIPKITVTKDTATTGHNKYIIKQGETEVYTLDIDVEQFLDDVDLVVVDDEHPVTDLDNGTYLHFTFIGGKSPVYVDVKDLANDYGVVTGVTDGIQLALGTDHKFSATIVGQPIAEDNLTDELAEKINSAADALEWGTIGG